MALLGFVVGVVVGAVLVVLAGMWRRSRLR